MHRQRTDSILLTENVKLELIHEANPYFAGDHVSVVIRLEHLGSEEERNRLRTKLEDLDREKNGDGLTSEAKGKGEDYNDDTKSIEPQGPGLVRSLFNVFLGERERGIEDEASTAEKLLEQENSTYNDQLRRILERQLELQEPVDLLSGYLQITGFFYFDSSFIDEEKISCNTSKVPGLAHLMRRRTNSQLPISLDEQQFKKNGINTGDMDDRETATHSYGLNERLVATAKYYNSDFSRDYPTNTPFQSQADLMLSSSSTTSIKCSPIFLIPQTLLFPEIQLCPGEVRTFHFKSKRLPLDMCPSYESSAKTRIAYSLEFGANLINDGLIQPLSSTVPITISPYVSPRGYQYTAKLDGKVFVAPTGSIRDISNVELPRDSQSAIPFSLLDVATGPRSRSSTIQSSMSVSKEEKEQLKQKFADLVVRSLDGTRHIEDLVDIVLETQFGKLLDPLSSDENVSEQTYVPHVHKDSARVNLENLMSMPISNLLDEEAQREEEEVEIVEEEEEEGPDEDEDEGGEQDLRVRKREQVRRVRRRAVSIVAAGRPSPQLKNLQKSYIINKNGVQVAHVDFSRYFYTTSDDIQLTIDFGTGSIGEKFLSMVSGVSVTLELIEKLNPNFAVSESLVNGDGQSFIPITASHSTSFDRTDIIPITLMTPRTLLHRISGQFKTNVFEVRWAVSLRFVLIDKNSENNMFRFYGDKRGSLLHSNDIIEGEEFICRIPIVIIPSPAGC